MRIFPVLNMHAPWEIISKVDLYEAYRGYIALAFGTLGLGIAEFVMMGILPDVAKDLGISIPTAGHFISAYALGVCVGAPVLTLARKYPLKHILLVLVTLIMIGNICAAMAPNYWVLLIARFISGLPHGAYFGVGSIVAERLADKGKGSEAVSIMIAGMTIANLFGVPLGTSLSTMLSWTHHNSCKSWNRSVDCKSYNQFRLQFPACQNDVQTTGHLIPRRNILSESPAHRYH